MKVLSLGVAAAGLLVAGTALATAQTMPRVQGGNPATGPAMTGPTGNSMGVNAPAMAQPAKPMAKAKSSKGKAAMKKKSNKM